MSELIGREEELAALADLVASAQDGSVAIQVRADPGMGKTALLDAAALLAERQGLLVLRGAGTDTPSPLSYAVLADLFGPVLDEVANELPTPMREALEVVVLRRPSPDSELDPHAVARAALTALTVLSRTKPLVVTVDDAHWLDPETARVLAFALPRLGDAPVAVVLASRDERLRTSVDLESALRSVPGGRGTATIRLGALSQRDTVALADREEGRRLTRGELVQVHQVSGGNPLYVLELARAQRRLSAGALVDVPSSLAELIGRRIDGLPAGSTEALATMALVAKPTRPLIVAASGGSAEEVDAALDEGIEAGVLIERDGVLAFTHPLLGLAAASKAPLSFVRSAHSRLAQIEQEPELRAAHLARASTQPDDEVAAIIEEGAEDARRRAAPDVAARLGEASLRLTPPERTADLVRRHLITAYHHAAAGNIAAALEHADAALPLAAGTEQTADLQWRGAMFRFLLGDLDGAIDGLRTARATTGIAELRDELTRRVANMLCWQGRMRDVLEEFGPDLERIAASGQSPAATAVETVIICRHVTGQQLGFDPVAHVHEQRAQNTQIPPHDDPAIRLAPAILRTTSAASAVSLLEPALPRAEAEGDDLALAWLGSRLSIAALAAGDVSRAREVAEDALAAAERIAGPPALSYALTAVGVLAAMTEQDETVQAVADRLRAVHGSHSLLFSVPQAELILGYVAWTAGELDTAVARFDSAEAELRNLGVVEPTMPFLRWYRTDILIDAGRLDEAADEATALLRLGNALDHSFAIALGNRALGRLKGDVGRFETALDYHDVHRWPFERALTQYHHGVALRRARRIRDARAALLEASEVFTTFGARRWATRASAELARLGGRTSRPGQLTPGEQRVAELAARGLTNQEIATQLVVSARTVASQLSSAYAKLGTRSRTELARHLAADGT